MSLGLNIKFLSSKFTTLTERDGKFKLNEFFVFMEKIFLLYQGGLTLKKFESLIHLNKILFLIYTE